MDSAEEGEACGVRGGLVHIIIKRVKVKKGSVISVACDPAFVASTLVDALAEEKLAYFIVDDDDDEEGNGGDHEVEEAKRACTKGQLQERNVAEDARQHCLE